MWSRKENLQDKSMRYFYQEVRDHLEDTSSCSPRWT